MTEKKDFLQMQKEMFKEWTRQVDEIKTRAKKAQVDASVKFDNTIDDLRDKYEAALANLEAVKNSGDRRWEELKSAVDAAWEELRQGVEKARNMFR